MSAESEQKPKQDKPDKPSDGQADQPSAKPMPKWSRRFFGLDSSTHLAASRDRDQAKQQEEQRQERAQGWKLASSGLELGFGIVMFAGLGYLVDGWLGTEPWLLVTGALLGMAGGLYLLIKAVQ